MANEVTRMSASIGVPIVLDGGGSALAPGFTISGIELPFVATITGWTVSSDTVGSIVLTVSKSSYPDLPIYTEISGSEKPTLSNEQKNQILDLSTWMKSVSSGDLLQVGIDSVSAITRATINIRMTRIV